MVPSWFITTSLIFIGGLFAIYVGYQLPIIEHWGKITLGWDGLSLSLILIITVYLICSVTSNFPLLLALAIWFPFNPPLPFFKTFPPAGLVFMWFTLVTFFKICLTRRVDYVPSCNIFMLLCFVWVPIRFILSPIEQLGATVVGGSGVSGASAYFSYCLAGAAMVLTGAMMNTRARIDNFFLWTYRWCMIIGLTLLACAFLPFTWSTLTALGMFSAGTINGVLRIVQLPGYGLVLMEAACCPAAFRLKGWQQLITFLGGALMMVVGGNRQAMAAAFVAVPVALFLRRKTGLLTSSILGIVVLAVILQVVSSTMPSDQIPPFFRSFGFLNSKIDQATGGGASATWRYAVWESALKYIKQAPLIGKGYGHLDKRNDTSRGGGSIYDFEVIIAGGEAHNGFISAAYGFGIPFAVALTSLLALRLITHMWFAFNHRGRDLMLRDTHTYLAATFATSGVLVYTSFDLSVTYFWIYIGTGFALQRIVEAGEAPPEAPKRVSEVTVRPAPVLT